MTNCDNITGLKAPGQE